MKKINSLFKLLLLFVLLSSSKCKRGSHDIAIGYVSNEPLEDTSVCVENILAQLGDAPLLDINYFTKKIRISDPVPGTYSLGSHNQGVGILSDYVIDGQKYARAVITNNSGGNSGLMVASQQIPSAVDGFYSDPNQIDYRQVRSNYDIIEVPEYGNHTHPGGLQAHGDFIAVAMEYNESDEGQPDRRAGVYFLKAEGFEIEHIFTHFLGDYPETINPPIDWAASAGFIKLFTGGYLLAISGQSNGKHGVWFYDSQDTRIHSEMDWDFVDYWTPNRMLNGVCEIDEGKVSNDCFIGGGGGTSLITGCDGNIYLVLFTGTTGGGIEDEYVQVMRLTQDEEVNRRINLESIWFDKRKLGRSALNNISFRWNGAAQVTNDGRLVFISTERRTKIGENDTVDGLIRIAGQNNRDF